MQYNNFILLNAVGAWQNLPAKVWLVCIVDGSGTVQPLPSNISSDATHVAAMNYLQAGGVWEGARQVLPTATSGVNLNAIDGGGQLLIAY